jgi:hypothetical protein
LKNLNSPPLSAYVRTDSPAERRASADVADLLGDDEDTVREHYARWAPERQARLTHILQAAFMDKPKARLVVLPGKSA